MKIFEFLSDMNGLKRWSQVHNNYEETVLEHTAFVSFYAYKIAIKYNLDIGLVLEKALLHDMEETIVGDIATPTKYANERLTNELKKLECEAALKISQTYFDGLKTHIRWQCAKDFTREGQAVAIADIASAVFKIWREYETGNKQLLKFKPNIIRGLTKLRNKSEFQDEINNLIEFTNDIGIV